jgi:hypothetical protein
MRIRLLLINILFLTKLSAQTWKTEDQYVQKFAAYAVEEMEKYKIPASITLAQGLLETGGGQSRLAQEGNNHFGIKCKEDWTGKTMKHTDDAPNECFRVYDHPKESYEDHSKFLAFRKYYVDLFKLDIKDYKSWAHGLKKAGYATNPRYAHILIDKIEKYKLYEFDDINSEQVNNVILKLYPELKDDKTLVTQTNQDKKQGDFVIKTENIADEKTKITETKKKSEPEKQKSKYEILSEISIKNHSNGNIKYFIVPDDIEIDLVSTRFEINKKKLKKWNELKGDFLKKNEIIFLEPKNNDGNVEIYKTKSGEKMHDIAQKFAIKLNKLYQKNRMKSRQ